MLVLGKHFNTKPESSMHHPSRGPLKRFLEKYISGVSFKSIVPKGINLPEDIKRDIVVGDLGEHFQIEHLKGLDDTSEDVLIGLLDKFYAEVGLKPHQYKHHIDGARWYSIDGSNKSLGVIVTYDLILDLELLFVTVTNFNLGRP